MNDEKQIEEAFTKWWESNVTDKSCLFGLKSLFKKCFTDGTYFKIDNLKNLNDPCAICFRYPSSRCKGCKHFKFAKKRYWIEPDKKWDLKKDR